MDRATGKVYFCAPADEVFRRILAMNSDAAVTKMLESLKKDAEIPALKSEKNAR